jgi:hypothetical protein
MIPRSDGARRLVAALCLAALVVVAVSPGAFGLLAAVLVPTGWSPAPPSRLGILRDPGALVLPADAAPATPSRAPPLA